MQKTQETNIDDPVLGQMFEVGAHYGYGKSRRHPSVKSHIYTTKNQVDIIDLEKTKGMLLHAKEFVKGLGATGKTVLFVGTKPECRETVRSAAESVGMPYVTERWIGGTLSNWSEIKKKITELENYQKESSEGGLAKYTKKEKLLLARRMEKLERFYSGILGLKKLPDALYIVDVKNDHIAREEANQVGIPVIGLLNSDSDLKNIDYPVLGNDAARLSVEFFSKEIANAYQAGTNETPAGKE